MNESRKASRHATNPPPEGLRGGTNGEVSWLRASTRLPGFPVALEWRAWPQWARLPVTVAGPRRSSTGFRVAPFVLLRFVLQPLV
jgi:hypothetical protein